MLAINGWAQCINKRAHGPNINKGPLTLQMMCKIVHLIAKYSDGPIIAVGPIKQWAQWAQFDVLALNGWAQCINKRAHHRMGPTSIKDP